MRLRWRQAGVDGDFGADALSDGTLRFLCLTTLLLQPEPPPLIVLDEPELGLHPYAITVLAGLLRSASSRSQLVAATQSVSLVNQFGLEDLFPTYAKVADRPAIIAAVGLEVILDQCSHARAWLESLTG